MKEREACGEERVEYLLVWPRTMSSCPTKLIRKFRLKWWRAVRSANKKRTFDWWDVLSIPIDARGPSQTDKHARWTPIHATPTTQSEAFISGLIETCHVSLCANFGSSGDILSSERWDEFYVSPSLLVRFRRFPKFSNYTEISIQMKDAEEEGDFFFFVLRKSRILIVFFPI